MNSPQPPPSQTSAPPVASISLPLEILRRLMFGSSVAEACQTRLVNIDPWPRIIEASVGRFIQKHDEKEVYFKVFIFPTHAEVWHTLDWERSFSRRLCVVKESTQAVYNHSLRSLLLEQILKIWRESGIKMTADVQAYAGMMVDLEDEVMFTNRGLLWLLQQWKALKNPHELPEWWGRKPAEDPMPEQPSETDYTTIK